ncbi:DUF2470 domain-containing protein [Nocardioides hwasunensis]|uniref:DUF2470 domain-containing protein n=1 Tax=Nocardioides hwasunensis TaxID=397258 RepID=A0ABR8MPV7_9ACTN|nr:DUF2470 domain-containing protein [Nocardioides hwasunensis]MBD3916129.1 hypothetical protein [Nocardioides hwasunensis]
MNPAEAALLARSVLSCPEAITLWVGQAREAIADEVYDVTCDMHGAPVFSAGDDSALLAAAHGGAVGMVEIASGLGDPTSAHRDLSLVLQGTLTQRDTGCRCCGDPRSLVALELTSVDLLSDDATVTVDVSRFRDHRHVLNPGYLQRTVEHANTAHEPELRSAMASTFGIPLQSMLAASLMGVDPCGVDVAWLDAEGAHPHRLDFVRPVSSPQELGAALRSHLHAGMC